MAPVVLQFLDASCINIHLMQAMWSAELFNVVGWLAIALSKVSTSDSSLLSFFWEAACVKRSIFCIVVQSFHVWKEDNCTERDIRYGKIWLYAFDFINRGYWNRNIINKSQWNMQVICKFISYKFGDHLKFISLSGCNRMLGGLILAGWQQDLGSEFSHMRYMQSLLHFVLHNVIFEMFSAL